jgi:hypothetical protein
VRLEGLDKVKYPPHPGLELAIFELVAQGLNQLRYRVPPTCCMEYANCSERKAGCLNSKIFLYVLF